MWKGGKFKESCVSLELEVSRWTPSLWKFLYHCPSIYLCLYKNRYRNRCHHICVSAHVGTGIFTHLRLSTEKATKQEHLSSDEHSWYPFLIIILPQKWPVFFREVSSFQGRKNIRWSWNILLFHKVRNCLKINEGVSQDTAASTNRCQTWDSLHVSMSNASNRL